MSAKRILTSEGYYLLRLPLMPLGIVDELLTDQHRALASLWKETAFAEAVHVASVSLHAQIEQHLATKGWPLPAALLRPLLKYALRMSTRATPFGLMAGCAPGYVSDYTQVRLQPVARRQERHTRLDMALFAQLVRQLVDNPAIRPQLRFHPTNSLYKAGREIRYVDCDTTLPDWQYFISAVENSPYLQTVFDLARSGATFRQLVVAVEEAGVDAETAQHFVDQLIDQRLLLSDIEPALTEPAPLTDLRTKLATFRETAAVVDTLEQVERLLTADQPAPVVQQQIADRLRNQFTIPPEQHFTQTDSFVNTAANQVSHRVVSTILDQVAELWPLNRSRSANAMRDFVQRFQQRYDQREIPLTEALDGDMGIGYGEADNGQTAYTPLLSGLHFPAPDQATLVKWGPSEELLLKKWGEGQRQPGQPVSITPAELASLQPDDWAAPATSIYLFGSLLGTSEAAIDAGDFQFYMQMAAGPSAATLLGRFCAHSAQLTELVQASLKREEAQQPDCLYAEIIHWPNNRTGNVLVRPALRQYEIPYNSVASVDDAHQIPVGDLLVSVRADGRVRLRSKRLGKEVIPRLSTAHNYKEGLPTYRFLADLQFDYENLSINWDWGLLKKQAYLPRVTYKNLILSRATWSLSVAQLPVQSAAALAHCLRTEHQLPRWVSLSQGDNDLLIDLDAAVTQQLLLEEANRLSTLRLTEWLALPHQCWLQDGPDRYVQELIIPCSYQPTQQQTVGNLPMRKPTGAIVSEASVPSRSFAPGSEWLYVKLYVGVYSADEVLTTVVEPLCRNLASDGLIDGYFFVRYFDPDFHVRLRLHSRVSAFVNAALSQLNERLGPYQQSGVVYRVQLDTYDRELERYGPAAIEQSELVFSADSQATLTYLTQEADAADRWLFALQSCDALLTDFGVDLRQKVGLLQQLQAHFLAEHRADQPFRKQLNDRYRTEQARIGQALSAQPACLAIRSETLLPIVRSIREHDQPNFEVALPSLLGSYLHMTLNRIFTAKHRAQELVIYHYLTRYYESQWARQTARRPESS